MISPYEPSGQPRVTRDLTRMHYPLQARVTKVVPPGDVSYAQRANNTNQTRVDLYLFDDYPARYLVPLLHPKANATNGENWSPEEGDLVLVAFIGGDISAPIVLGALPVPQVAGDPGTDHPHYWRSMAGTHETWDKDGNRTLHVAADDAVTITGDGAVAVGGNLTIIVTGDATIAVDGVVDLTGAGLTASKGVVQGDCICAFTGQPHPQVSLTVKASV